ncbi:hypothetical protein KA082_00610 [Candidatus Woesebacteria bacterium]|nr:hypothetical protein [Candidatus Woesebacteria bacterium]
MSTQKKGKRVVQKRPFILLTGDDSVRAEGLIIVKRIVEKFADFAIVATKEQQSAVGSKITFPGGSWGTEIVDGVEATWVDGTPSDAVYFAFDYLQRKPDLVLSGMNIGANMGNIIHRSGTVSALVTAAQSRQTPGVAFSLFAEHADWFKNHDGSFDEKHLIYPGNLIEKITKMALEHTFAPETFWNVNFPDKQTDKIVVAPLGTCKYWHNHQHIDYQKRTFVYADGHETVQSGPTDVEQLIAGHCTITPCHVEYTDHAKLQELAEISNLS